MTNQTWYVRSWHWNRESFINFRDAIFAVIRFDVVCLGTRIHFLISVLFSPSITNNILDSTEVQCPRFSPSAVVRGRELGQYLLLVMILSGTLHTFSRQTKESIHWPVGWPPWSLFSCVDRRHHKDRQLEFRIQGSSFSCLRYLYVRCCFVCSWQISHFLTEEWNIRSKVLGSWPCDLTKLSYHLFLTFFSLFVVWPKQMVTWHQYVPSIRRPHEDGYHKYKYQMELNAVID